MKDLQGSCKKIEFFISSFGIFCFLKVIPTHFSPCWMFLGIDSGLDVQSHFHFTSFTLVLFSFSLNYSWFLTYSFTTPTIIIYLSSLLSESLTFSLTIQSHLHFVCFSLVTTSFPLYCSWFPTYSVTTTYKQTNLVLYL